MNSPPLFVLKLGDVGPIPIFKDLENVMPEEDQELFLLKIGAFYLSIVGQGHEKFLGLFGPLPVTGLPVWQSYIFSFQVTDDTLQDERLQNIAYCVLVILFPENEIEEINFLRYHLEILLKKYFEDVKTVSDINKSTMTALQQSIIELRGELSVEWKKNQIIIKKRVTQSSLAAKINKITRMLEKINKNVSILVFSKNDDFLRSVASTIINMVTEWNENKSELSLLKGKVRFLQHHLKNRQSLPKSSKNHDVLVIIATTKDEILPLIPILEKNMVENQILAIIFVMEDDKQIRGKQMQTFQKWSKEIMLKLPSSLIFSRPFIIHPLAITESESIASFLLTLFELLT